MIVPSHRKVEVRSVAAMLAVALLLVPGCGQEESGTQAPPNPAPRADLGRTVEPRVPSTDQGDGTKESSRVEKDLHKDLAPPVIKPGGQTPTTTTTPPPNPAGAKTGTP